MLIVNILITLLVSSVLPHNISGEPRVEEIESGNRRLPPPNNLKPRFTPPSCTAVSGTCEPKTQLDYEPTGTSNKFNFRLSRGITSGTVLNIVASVTKTIQFNIKDDNGNILLNVIADIDNNNFHFNAYNDGWGTRENLSEMSIASGKKFSLLIAYESYGYHIYIDGVEVYLFKHRVHTADLGRTTFESFGGQIYSVSYNQNEPKWAVQQQQPIHGLYVKEFDDGKSSPEKIELELQGCNNLSFIVITGIVHNNSSSVSINLETLSGNKVLYFNPRFDENIIVYSVWDKEKTTIGMPIERNKKFVLAIDVERDYYIIYVNGYKIMTFKHRMPVNCITTLAISQGITVFKVTYHK